MYGLNLDPIKDTTQIWTNHCYRKRSAGGIKREDANSVMTAGILTRSCSPFEERLSLPGPTTANSIEGQFLTQNMTQQSNVSSHRKDTESGKSYPQFQSKTSKISRKEHESYNHKKKTYKGRRH